MIAWLLIADRSHPQSGYTLDGAAQRLALAYQRREGVSLRMIENGRERAPTALETRRLCDRAAWQIDGAAMAKRNCMPRVPAGSPCLAPGGWVTLPVVSDTPIVEGRG